MLDLFPTDGTGLIPLSNLRERFHDYIDELGIPADGLDLHSFRRSYSSDLQYKLGFDRAFVSLQLGHEHESTTSIYSFPAPTYASHQLKRVLDETLTAAMTDPLLRKPRFSTEGPR